MSNNKEIIGDIDTKKDLKPHVIAFKIECNREGLNTIKNLLKNTLDVHNIVYNLKVI